MAKGPLFLGPISGKVGNVVAYHIKYSADKETQAVRAYVSDVANPKTEPQAIQRMKMAPAVNFYRGLSEILDNAWQGERYGTMSRRYFMSLAMKQEAGIPFIPKGEKRFFPGQYRVSQGSLPSVAVSAFHDTGGTTWVNSSLTADMSLVNMVYGDFCAGLIEQNFGLQNGDKLTFVAAVIDSLGEYVPRYGSIVLDTNSEQSLLSVAADGGLRFNNQQNNHLEVAFYSWSGSIVAAAFILSRLDAGASAKWLRSNAVMVCTEDYLSLMMGAASYDVALRSYIDTSTYSSDWYLNVGLGGNSYDPTPTPSPSDEIDEVENFTLQGVVGQVGVATMQSNRVLALRSATSPSYIVGGQVGAFTYVVAQSNLASAAALQEIKTGCDENVSGWLTVEASPIDAPE